MPANEDVMKDMKMASQHAAWNIRTMEYFTRDWS